MQTKKNEAKISTIDPLRSDNSKCQFHSRQEIGNKEGKKTSHMFPCYFETVAIRHGW